MLRPVCILLVSPALLLLLLLASAHLMPMATTVDDGWVRLQWWAPELNLPNLVAGLT
jgi:hypothetical protein